MVDTCGIGNYICGHDRELFGHIDKKAIENGTK